MKKITVKSALDALLEERADTITLIDRLTRKKALLDEAILPLQKAASIDLSSLGNGDDESPYSGYPAGENRSEKILFVMKTERRAMLGQEIQTIIKSIEGPDKSRAALRGFNYMMSVMQQAGQICMAKVDGSNKQAYYIMPDFLDDNGILKPEHAPTAAAWNRLPQHMRNTEKLIWQKGG